MELRTEQASDWWEVEALYDLTFAPGREALSSYRLRDGIAPVADLCLVARDDDGVLGGAIRYWPVRVADLPALLLGPVAVHPTRQGEGLGGWLMEQSLARATGWDRVLLVGDAPYYGRFGFKKLEGGDHAAAHEPRPRLGARPDPRRLGWRQGTRSALGMTYSSRV